MQRRRIEPIWVTKEPGGSGDLQLEGEGEIERCAPEVLGWRTGGDKHQRNPGAGGRQRQPFHDPRSELAGGVIPQHQIHAAGADKGGGRLQCLGGGARPGHHKMGEGNARRGSRERTEGAGGIKVDGRAVTGGFRQQLVGEEGFAGGGAADQFGQPSPRDAAKGGHRINRGDAGGQGARSLSEGRGWVEQPGSGGAFDPRHELVQLSAHVLRCSPPADIPAGSATRRSVLLKE